MTTQTDLPVSIRLSSGYDSDSSALLFAELFRIAVPVVEHYFGDFYHDALWIENHVSGTTTFFYAFNDCGTVIGTDLDTVAYGRPENVYRVEYKNIDQRQTVELTRLSPAPVGK